MRILDLFSGAGGFSLGFERVFKGSKLVPYEIDDHSLSTYNLNMKTDFEKTDVLSVKKFPKSSIVIGGPPCQGFSNANTRKSVLDNRNDLYHEVLRAAQDSGARVFVIENVPGFFSKGAVKRIHESGYNMGYEVVAHRLNVSRYGAATSRIRWVVIGIKTDRSIYPYPPNEIGISILKDAIGDMPQPALNRKEEVIDWHSYTDTPHHRLIIQSIPHSSEHCRQYPKTAPLLWLRENAPEYLPPSYRTRDTKFFSQVYGRMTWEKPAPGLKSTFYKPYAGPYTHPSGNRTITMREGARIQSFPDDFVFLGPKKSVAKQIANAVPPSFAYHVAMMVKQHMIDAKIL